MSKTAVELNIKFQKYKEEINQTIANIFNEPSVIIDLELSANSREALEKLAEYSLRPGKRIRGSLASLAYDYMTGSNYGPQGLQAAAAVELIQSYLLIVDDVMDKSDLRRGLPTIHTLYLNETEGEKHAADMMAVNVGLIAQHLASSILADIDEVPQRVNRASYLFHHNILATTFGQIDDLDQHSRVSEVTDRDILRMYKLKSSYYTFINPLQIGLVLGGLSKPAVLKEIEQFGDVAGIAFQLYDDLLGIFGDSKTTGKSNLDDVKEGKYTLLMWHAFNHAQGKDLTWLKETLGNSEIINADLVRIQAILEKCGSREFVEKKAGAYAGEAERMISSSDFWDDKSKGFLKNLVEYSTRRER